MGVKERRTKILLLLFLLSDIDLAPVTVDEKVQQIFDLSLNQKTKSTLTAMIREGVILKTSQDEPAHVYCLTEKGVDSLVLHFPFFRFLRREWDGKWRILSYEIPEQRRELRDRLRREVAGWGLGPWHRSFWVTPHPIIENLKQLVTGKEEEKYVQAFESDHSFGDEGVLIEKVWGTTMLDKKYRELFKQWHVTLSQDQEKTEKLKRVVGDYVAILRQDPGLPKKLMGDNWIGFEAFNIFKEIRNILLS